MPGDIIIADDDGVVVCPKELAPELVKKALSHNEWEEFCGCASSKVASYEVLPTFR